MKNNTVVTAGGINYLWGLFMLIASMRKSGMDEPVLVGAHNFTPEAEAVLKQFGECRSVPRIRVWRRWPQYSENDSGCVEIGYREQFGTACSPRVFLLLSCRSSDQPPVS